MKEKCKECLCSKCTDNGNPETSPNSTELLSVMNGCMHCVMCKDKDTEVKDCRVFKQSIKNFMI